MSKDLDRMLGSPNKGVREATGVLAKLYRQILADLDITPMKFNQLMEKYLQDPKNKIPPDSKNRSSERGNLIKEMRRSDMTWKVFLKCIRFLSPVEMRFEVHLKWGDKKTTIHGVNMKIFNSEQRTDEQHDIQSNE